MLSVSANYQTEEDKVAGAEPKTYVAIMRETDSIDIDDGTHTNTENESIAGTAEWELFTETVEYSIQSIVEYDSNLYIGTYSNGKIYSYASGVWALSTDTTEWNIYDLKVYSVDNKLYAAGDLNIYSFDGTDWTVLTPISDIGSNYCIAEFNNILYFGFDSSDIYSYDTTDWTLITDLNIGAIQSMIEYDSKLFVGSQSAGSGDVYSYDGTDWTISTDIGPNGRNSFAIYNSELFLATFLALYSFDGTDWTLSTDGTPGVSADPLLTFNNKLYSNPFYASSVYKYDGTDWTEDTDFKQNSIENYGEFSSSLYAGTGDNGKLFIKAAQENLKLKDAQDSGNWESNNFDTGHLTPNTIYDLVSWSETLNGGTIDVQLKTASTEGGLAGASYTDYTNATLDHTERNRWYKLKASLTRSSTAELDDWTLFSDTLETNFQAFGIYDNQLFMGTGTGAVIYSYDSTDWTVSTELGAFQGDTSVQDFIEFSVDSLFYAATGSNGKIYTYDGTDWTLNSDIAVIGFYKFTEYDSELYIGANDAGSNGYIYSYDGTDWTIDTDTAEATIRSAEVLSSNNRLYMGGESNAYLYSYGGTDWTIDTNLPQKYIYSLQEYNSELYIAQGPNTNLYSYDGVDWTLLTSFDSYDRIYAMEAYENNKLYINVTDDVANDSAIFEYDITDLTESTVFSNTNGGWTLKSFNNKLYTGVDDKIYSNKMLSPKISNITVRHKALVPKDEYVNLGSITYGVRPNFYEMFAGNCSIIVDNKSYKWEKYQATSYIYNKDYQYKKIEIWAGFELSDGSVEWLLQFLGEIESIVTNSGLNSSYNASISARDYIYNRLNKNIGLSTSDGTPRPYLAGRRYRDKLYETSTATVYEFYGKRNITAVNAVYVRDSNSQLWVSTGDYSASIPDKEIDFGTDPSSEACVDITASSSIHPADIIKDILTSELNFTSDMYSASSFTTAKAVNSSLTVGVYFENINAIQAIKMLLRVMDGMIYIDEGVLKIKAYQSSMAAAATKTYTTANSNNLKYYDVVSDTENVLLIPYGNYKDNKTNLDEVKNSSSIRKYKRILKNTLSYTYDDNVSINSLIIAPFTQYLDRMGDKYEIVEFTVNLEILRTEIFDLIAVTNAFHNITAKKFWVLEITKNLSNYTGRIKGILYADQ